MSKGNDMHGHRVLLIEDDVSINMSIREFLEESGFRVESAYCGGAAFEALDRGRYLSALVTDVELGPGPDGFDVARHARLIYPALPVVFVSGTAGARHAEEGVLGSQFVPKPLHPSHVVEALARVLPAEPPHAGRPQLLRLQAA
jgi:CheY-like chemotaxis protein